jgi:hypothetical protein
MSIGTRQTKQSIDVMGVLFSALGQQSHSHERQRHRILDRLIPIMTQSANRPRMIHILPLQYNHGSRNCERPLWMRGWQEHCDLLQTPWDHLVSFLFVEGKQQICNEKNRLTSQSFLMINPAPSSNTSITSLPAISSNAEWMVAVFMLGTGRIVHTGL